MRWVKLFLKFYWPGNTKIYALIAESYVFISEIAQRFAQLSDQAKQLWPSKQRTQFFRENKMRQINFYP